MAGEYETPATEPSAPTPDSPDYVPGTEGGAASTDVAAEPEGEPAAPADPAAS